MTTHSRERREAVRKALLHEMERIGGGWNAGKMADAALSAALPDRAVFVALLNHCMVWSGLIAVDETDAVAVLMRDEAVKQLLSLVYGADDAQAGEVE